MVRITPPVTNGIRAGSVLIIEGYKQLIKEQEDLIRRLCMDLEQVQKERKKARQALEPQLFVDLNGGRRSDEEPVCKDASVHYFPHGTLGGGGSRDK